MLSEPRARCPRLRLKVSRAGRHVYRVFAKHLNRNDLENSLVRRRENHVRGRAIAMGTKPVGGRHTPPIPRRQAAKPVLGCRRAEVVANGDLMLKKLGGDDCADGVTPPVFRPRGAASIAVEAREGLKSARLQLSA